MKKQPLLTLIAFVASSLFVANMGFADIGVKAGKPAGTRVLLIKHADGSTELTSDKDRINEVKEAVMNGSAGYTVKTLDQVQKAELFKEVVSDLAEGGSADYADKIAEYEDKAKAVDSESVEKTFDQLLSENADTASDEMEVIYVEEKKLDDKDLKAAVSGKQ